MTVDPSVVITLRSRWSIMQPTKGFCEGYLLPLAGILDHNTYIRLVILAIYTLVLSIILLPCLPFR